MTNHSKYSPSASKIWLNCTGQLGLKNELIDKKIIPAYSTSAAAEEGTLAHEFAELLLKGDDVFIADEEMRKYVQEYVDYVNSLLSEKSFYRFEVQVKFDEYATEGFGTVDALVFKDKTAHVIDFKYGKNVFVSAENNTQLLCYALAVHQMYGSILDIKQYCLHVVQPRMDNISTFLVNKEDLLAFGEKVKAASKAIESKQVTFSPNKSTCLFCECKPHCKALLKHSQEITKLSFKDLTKPSSHVAFEKLTDDDMKNIIKNKSLIESFIKSVYDKVYSLLSEGHEVADLALKESRSMRKYTENAEGVLHSLLNDDAFNKKLISVGEAEKRLGKKTFDELGITIKETYYKITSSS